MRGEAAAPERAFPETGRGSLGRPIFRAGFKSGPGPRAPVFFTEAEANAALPAVSGLMGKIIKESEEMGKLQALMAQASSLGEWIPLKQRFNSSAARFHARMEEMESSGAMVKSVEQGLVDFPSKRFGEEVWLCWKYGEDGVKFWHEVDSGFAGRKPLEVSDEALV